MIQDERTALWPYESLGLPTYWSKCKRTYALPFYDFDLRASHARTLLPAALASVPFGFVLVRVRVRITGGSSDFHTGPEGTTDKTSNFVDLFLRTIGVASRRDTEQVLKYKETWPQKRSRRRYNAYGSTEWVGEINTTSFYYSVSALYC